jgi:hypothetical protein
MTVTKTQSKIEQSPHFEKIVELYRTHNDSLSKKEIFTTYIQPLDNALQYHQFIRLTVKLNGRVAKDSTKVIAEYVDGEVNTTRMRQELYLKALQLGDQSLTSTLELWENHPEKITSKQLRDFFKMYGEMEKVRQTDQMIDLKKQEQEFEQKFKPAGLFADQWLKLYRWAHAGGITKEEMAMFQAAVNPIWERIENRYKQRQQGADFQNKTQVVEAVPSKN